MLVAEIFKSVQGEGSLSGTSSVFVRTSGCNLRSGSVIPPTHLGSPKAKSGPRLSVAQQVLDWNDRHVVITGGEPMLQPNWSTCAPNSTLLGGILPSKRPVRSTSRLSCDLMSISPKLSNSTPTLPAPPRHGSPDTNSGDTRRL